MSSLREQFTAALLTRHTYDPVGNGYAAFGILWGIPVPLFGLAVDLIARKAPWSAQEVAWAYQTDILHWIFLAHPLLFMIIFGAFGTIKMRDDAQIQESLRQLREISITDYLTGLYNHRFFRETLDEEWARARRDNQPLSLIMGDLDNFKILNDTHGHPAGDDVLRETARLLKHGCREYDKAARYGGEEFVLILPNTTKAEAAAIATRFCLNVARHPMTGKRLVVTISMGVATAPDDCQTADDLITRADTQLYRAKSSGKNRACADGIPDISDTRTS